MEKKELLKKDNELDFFCSWFSNMPVNFDVSSWDTSSVTDFSNFLFVTDLD